MVKIRNLIAAVILLAFGYNFINVSSKLYTEGGLSIIGSFSMGIVGFILIGIIGYEIALGNPIDTMLPENKLFKIEWISFAGGKVIYLLLITANQNINSAKNRPVYFEIRKDRFENVNSEKLKIGATIKNIYGTIEIISTSS